MNDYNISEENYQHKQYHYLQNDEYKIVSTVETSKYIEFTIEKKFNPILFMKSLFIKKEYSLTYRYYKNKKSWFVPKGFLANKKVINFLNNKI